MHNKQLILVLHLLPRWLSPSVSLRVEGWKAFFPSALSLSLSLSLSLRLAVFAPLCGGSHPPARSIGANLDNITARGET